ncbi:MAG: hypothetical protein ACRC8T_06715 [Acidaminococcaceae bacterium]
MQRAEAPISITQHLDVLLLTSYIIHIDHKSQDKKQNIKKTLPVQGTKYRSNLVSMSFFCRHYFLQELSEDWRILEKRLMALLVINERESGLLILYGG